VDGLFRAVLDRLGTSPSLADEARCAGLLGAVLADLRPLSYQPPDGRYEKLLNRVLGIFDVRWSEASTSVSAWKRRKSWGTGRPAVAAGQLGDDSRRAVSDGALSGDG
jgi:hypothetical protein